MKAAVLYGKEDVRVEDVPLPKLKAGEVRIAMTQEKSLLWREHGLLLKAEANVETDMINCLLARTGLQLPARNYLRFAALSTS